jgi:type IV pilus assembly protein PilE
MIHSMQRGLTLIELMVVVAVLAILASVAYPLYTNQAQKSRRADAKAALQTIALAQERFFTVNNKYAGNLSSLQISPEMQGGASDEGYYTITLTLAGADNEQFTVTAAAGGPQAADTDCAQFTINHQGVKGATDGGGTDCW